MSFDLVELGRLLRGGAAVSVLHCRVGTVLLGIGDYEPGLKSSIDRFGTRSFEAQPCAAAKDI